ncbi:MAG: hypothetical protein WKG07_06070 [Hymenobacter sp.]
MASRLGRSACDYNSPYNTTTGTGWRSQQLAEYKLFGGGANVRRSTTSARRAAMPRRALYLSGTFNDQKGIIIGNRFRRGQPRA